jgi:hypothetical protein
MLIILDRRALKSCLRPERVDRHSPSREKRHERSNPRDDFRTGRIGETERGLAKEEH